MRKLAIIMGFMLTASCFLASCGNEEQTAGVESRETGQEQSVETITLTAVSFLPIDDPLTVTLHDWVKEVEKVTEGRVKIDWKGGRILFPSQNNSRLCSRESSMCCLPIQGNIKRSSRHLSPCPSRS